MAEEQFQFTAKAKKKLSILAVVGVVLLILGIFSASSNSHADEAGHSEETEQLAESHEADGHAVESHAGEEAHAEEGHAGNPTWLKRIYANLWINNMYFVGLGLLGVFFVAIQYVSQAGWSAALIRIPMSFGNWLPIGGILTLIIL